MNNDECRERGENLSLYLRGDFDRLRVPGLRCLRVDSWADRLRTDPDGTVRVLTLKGIYAEGLQQKR